MGLVLGGLVRCALCAGCKLGSCRFNSSPTGQLLALGGADFKTIYVTRARHGTRRTDTSASHIKGGWILLRHRSPACHARNSPAEQLAPLSYSIWLDGFAHPRNEGKRRFVDVREHISFVDRNEVSRIKHDLAVDDHGMNGFRSR